jgi:hypothetical protein
MPVRLPDVVARAAKVDPSDLPRLVREVIAACGLEVAGDGEVYNPAEGAYRSRSAVVPRDQRFRSR